MDLMENEYFQTALYESFEEGYEYSITQGLIDATFYLQEEEKSSDHYSEEDIEEIEPQYYNDLKLMEIVTSFYKYSF